MRGLLGAAAVAAIGIAGCGSSTPSTTSSAVATVTPRPVQIPSTFPAHDTPIDQAPAALAAKWRPYGVRVIPGREVFAHVPTTELTPASNQVPNAREILDANTRTNALIGWAEAHQETTLLTHLQSAALNTGPIFAALGSGPVIDPPCDLYFSSAFAVPLDPAVVVYLKREKGNDVHGAQAVLAYTGNAAGVDCAVTLAAPGASPSPIGRVGQGQRGFDAGEIRHDHVLGTLWWDEGGAGCDTGSPPQEVCRP